MLPEPRWETHCPYETPFTLREMNSTHKTHKAWPGLILNDGPQTPAQRRRRSVITEAETRKVTGCVCVCVDKWGWYLKLTDNIKIQNIGLINRRFMVKGMNWENWRERKLFGRKWWGKDRVREKRGKIAREKCAIAALFYNSYTACRWKRGPRK